MKQYCITGKSRLTRQREVITIPCSLQNAVEILKREKAKPANKRDYLDMRLAVYPPEIKITQLKNK